MMPIGPLMIEHRLIEKMIKIMKDEIEQIGKSQKVDPAVIDKMVDFVRVYADRCHHGKEEDILFRELRKKKISPEHEQIMGELLEEHIFGRKTTAALVGANERYAQGEKSALQDIKKQVQTLIDFYPQHIIKEDKHFFIPIMDYFSPEEKDTMLKEGFEFDQKLIHEKYKNVINSLKNR